MGKSPSCAPPAASQAAKFVEAARAAGADDDEAAFKAKLAEIARQKVAGEPHPAPPARKKQPKN